MNLISQILPAERVFIDMPVSVQSDLFDRVGEVFARELGLAKKHVVSALSQREKLGSTGLGQGVAIPHGRIKGLKQAEGVFVRTKAPIEFAAPDGAPVSMVFIMLVPEQANESHLRLLSELAQIFSDRGFRDRLGEAADATEAWSLFESWNPNAANERSAAV
jgi:PTS system nitrogen regulatory IIA component